MDWGLIVGAIIAGLFGVLNVFFAHWLKKRPDRTGTQPSRLNWKKIFLVTGIIFLVVFFLFISIFVFFAVNAKPTAEITYPTSGSTVTMKETVRGTSANIQSGKQIWVFVDSPETNRFYPMEFAATVQTGGDWSCQTTFGKENNNGDHFDLIVILADQTCKNEISNYFQTQVNPTTDYYPGMVQLPSTAIVLDEIGITRNL